MNRELLIVKFLKQHQLKHAQRVALGGDASFRRYERLITADKHIMLMDAPPPQEDIRPFITVDHLLRGNGLNAPEIYAHNSKNGLMLLEDFGDLSYTKVLNHTNTHSNDAGEETLYLLAIDVLAHLQQLDSLLPLPHYDNALYKSEVELLTQWFLPLLNTEDHEQATSEYQQIWEALYNKIDHSQPTIVLRDYHADNLMWLPHEQGIKRVGLLDFQDAVVGSPIYDLISLLEDARRDICPQVTKRAKEHFIQTCNIHDKDTFEAQYALLAAQRNCKILGIFARLAQRDHKPHYLSFLPRVWNHLQHDLTHPILSPLKQWLELYIPQDLFDRLHPQPKAKVV